MIQFTDPRLYVKGIGSVLLKDSQTGDIKYYSNKFQTGNITTSNTMGEIRAGLGNPIAAVIPSDGAVNVEFNAADFSLWAKAAQLGAAMTYNAPTMVCQTVKAGGSGALIVDIEETGTPVPEVGFTEPHCYVQKAGAASPIASNGAAYPISDSNGEVSGFAGDANQMYLVWYFTNKPSSQMATINANIDPEIVHFTAELAVFSSQGSAQNEGTRVGSLYIVVPKLKLGGNGGVTGDQTNNDTTVISGTALVHDSDVVTDTCASCGQNYGVLAYYLYVPCDGATAVQGLVLVGGVVSLPVETTKKAEFYLVMPDGSTVAPDPERMYYALDGAPTGTTVNSTTGVITAGDTAGDCEITATYTEGADTFTCTANVSVTAANP